MALQEQARNRCVASITLFLFQQHQFNASWYKYWRRCYNTDSKSNAFTYTFTNSESYAKSHTTDSKSYTITNPPTPSPTPSPSPGYGGGYAMEDMVVEVTVDTDPDFYNIDISKDGLALIYRSVCFHLEKWQATLESKKHSFK